MLSKFTLAFFILTLNAVGSATVQQDYGHKRVASQGFRKRNHLTRRRNTPERGSAGEHGGIVVPLRKIAFHTRYTGEIVIRGKTLHVAFGTAALGLTVISDSTCEALGGRQLVGGDMKVNLFDGFGSGVECQDTTIHVVSQDTTHVGGMISQKPAKIGLLNHHRIEGFNPSNTALGIVPLGRADNQLSFMKQLIEDQKIEPVFAFAHRPHPRKRIGKGELHLGMIKNNYIATGGLEYHDCAAGTAYWMVDDLATITIGDYKVENVRTIFDTASRLVRGPEHEVSEIYENIKKPFQRQESGVYTSSYTDMEKNVPDVTFQWGINGKKWKFPSKKFGQGAAAQENQVLGLFAPHTKFTAWPTTLRPAPLFVPSPPPFAMIPTLEPPVHLMGPSPYLEKKVAEPPVHPQTSVLPVQVMPNDNDWIIPFPVMEAIGYVVFDRRDGKCRIGMSSLPSGILTFSES